MRLLTARSICWKRLLRMKLFNASIAGMQSYAAGRSYAYSASKAAVIQFSRQMAKNYASDGVRVNCICPGIIETPILGERNRADYAERIPLGYIGSPDDVANAVSFLASKDAEYITGAVLPVDGEGAFETRLPLQFMEKVWSLIS